MNTLQAFIAGVAGAFVVYVSLYRDTRIREFLENPREHWRILIFDIVVYLGCGGLVTIFLIDPRTPKDAFIGGCGWQGLVGGALAGRELKTLKKRDQGRLG